MVRVRELLGVLRETRPVWLGLLPPLLPLFAAWPLSLAGELCVRIAGYVVTLLGVGLVARGVFETQQLFGRPRLRDRVRAWRTRLVAVFKPRSLVVAVSGASLNFGGSASATATVGPPPTRSMSKRLEAVEAAVLSMQTQISASEQALRTDIAKVRAEVAAERVKLASQHEALAAKVEAYSAGSLDSELIGVAWLIIGQAFGSFPGEIACLLVRWNVWVLGLAASWFHR